MAESIELTVWDNYGAGTSYANPEYAKHEDALTAYAHVPGYGSAAILQGLNLETKIAEGSEITGFRIAYYIVWSANVLGKDALHVTLFKDGAPQEWVDFVTGGTTPLEPSLFGTTWTAADVNSENFGVGFKFDNPWSYYVDCWVSYIIVEITYVPAVTINAPTATATASASTPVVACVGAPEPPAEGLRPLWQPSPLGSMLSTVRGGTGV